MKSASIVTMHFPFNFGAVLQAYALCHYLQSLGVQTRIINYIPSYFQEKNSIWYVSEKYKKSFVLRLLYYLVMIPKRIQIRRAFALFRKNELVLTKRYSQDELMSGDAPKTDLYFCGSDQIWNEINNTIKDPIYFLQFVKDPNKRFSYASSGTIQYPFSDEINHTVIKWLDEFCKISVREDIMKNDLSTVLHKEIKHVCDPVFLLNREEWITLAQKGKKQYPERFVLVYVIGDDDTPYRIAKEIKEKYKIPVLSPTWFNKPNVDIPVHCSPYDFISLFANASYIITNSFHGTAFSIIFKREFWVCDTSIANHRLYSLLRIVNLEHRVVTNSSLDYHNPISWDGVELKLNEHINGSREFLKNCI